MSCPLRSGFCFLAKQSSTRPKHACAQLSGHFECRPIMTSRSCLKTHAPPRGMPGDFLKGPSESPSRTFQTCSGGSVLSSHTRSFLLQRLAFEAGSPERILFVSLIAIWEETAVCLYMNDSGNYACLLIRLRRGSHLHLSQHNPLSSEDI